MKNKVSRDLRKNKAKDTVQHGAIGSNRGVGKGERAMKIKEKVSHLRDRRARNGVPMTVAPGPINGPLGLVIHSSGATSAVGKLTSHRYRETGMTCGSLEIRYAVS